MLGGWVGLSYLLKMPGWRFLVRFLGMKLDVPRIKCFISYFKP